MWDEQTVFELTIAVGFCGGTAIMDGDILLFDISTEPNSQEIIEEMIGGKTISPGMYSVTGTYCQDFADENGQSSSEFKNVKWELIK